MRRLSTVALGVALCTLASGAEARPRDFTFAPHDSYPHYAGRDWGVARPRSKGRAARDRSRRRAAAPAKRRSDQRLPLAGRTLAALARGGTSRSCLTPAARALLARIEAEFGALQVISTCRPGAVIAGSGRPSRHASGNAIDFKAPAGRKGEVVRWLIANHRSGGIMTYAGMSHIHVDIGRRFVSLNSGASRARQRSVSTAGRS
jgi:hypothetical protein